MILFGLACLLGLTLLGYWWLQAAFHRQRLEQLKVRVHVNGIRGKSTVVRQLAEVLAAAGYSTIAKVTGSCATVIHPDRSQTAVKRFGAATILEQLDVLRDHLRPETSACVIECMAVNPLYQAVSEAWMIRSNIGVITNVRHDHQDVMGRTLPHIAQSLLNTCPRDGVLITAETDDELVAIMRTVAARRGSRVVVADAARVPDALLRRWDGACFKENLAIGLALADQLGLPAPQAIEAMRGATIEPGALRVEHLTVSGHDVTWANFFSVNDTESVLLAMDRVMEHAGSDSTVVAILNNRADREDRAVQFADFVSGERAFEYIGLFGALESQVMNRLLANGVARDRIISLGDARDLSVQEVVQALIGRMPSRHVILVGLVNNHTRMARRFEAFLACQRWTAWED